MKLVDPNGVEAFLPPLHYGMTLKELVGKVLGARNMVVSLGRMQAGGGAHAHVHDGEHTIYLLQGELTVSNSCKTVTLKEGMAVYIPAEEVHETKNLGPGEAVYLIVTAPPPT